MSILHKLPCWSVVCASIGAIALAPSAAWGGAASLLSAANLAQRAASRTQSASPLANPGIQAQIAFSAANLAQAAQALKTANATQTAASASSQLTLNGVSLSNSSWNGGVLSGLNPVDDMNPSLWINAGPLQKNGATATATVHQTAPNALLTWQSFDLNKGETLVFDQQGGATWTVLNRIVAAPPAADGSRFVASPSYILGSVQAPGGVYVINPNGIIFGPHSQIDVHSLIASTLDVGDPTMTLAQRNAFFLNNGITNPTNIANGHLSFSYNAADKAVEGDVTVDAGAVISANVAPRSVSPDAGGFVYLLAPNVENDGTITAPEGEILMVAAQSIQLTPNAYLDDAIGSVNNGTLTTDPTFRAVGINTSIAQLLPGGVSGPWRSDGVTSAEITVPGRVTNTGLIQSDGGVVILNGDNVTQGGIIQTNTSITRNGEIFLDARLKLTLAANSNTQNLPDENGETIAQSAISNGAVSSFASGAIEMRGNIVDLEPKALIEAPGAHVTIEGLGEPNFSLYPATADAALAAQESLTPLVYMAADSVIDVSGLDGVTLPMSANFISFRPFGNEFADQPLQRNGALVGQELTFDIRYGTPLADVSGMVANVQYGVDQLLTVGGAVTLSSVPGAGGEIILRQGSTINVAGGYVQYQGGVVTTTDLLTADGRILNIANASPLNTYVGIAGVSTLEHPRWGSSTTKTFFSPLFSGQFEPGYIEGHDAGTISLNAQSYALDGTFLAGVVIGERQAALGNRPSSKNPNSVAALASDPNTMPNAGSLIISGLTNFVLENNVAPLPSNFAIGDPLPSGAGNDRLDNLMVSALALTEARFRSLAVTVPGTLTVAQDADLAVVPGGAISLTGGSVDIEGQLAAPSGTISATATALGFGNSGNPNGSLTSSILLGGHSLLDASGIWVDDAGATLGQVVGGAYVDGGTIALRTNTASLSCGAACFHDLTGSITISAGGKLDVSSGGRIDFNGDLQLTTSGRPVGAGGSITLDTYVGEWLTDSVARAPPTTAAPSATVIFSGSDGTTAGVLGAFNNAISAYGFDHGGTLEIQVPAIQIGGAPSSEPGVFYLPPSFFLGNAFGAYNLVSVVGSVSVAPNTTLILRQQNFIADPTLQSLPSGTKVANVATLGFQPDFLRAPVNLQVTATLPGVAYPFVFNGGLLPPQMALSMAEGSAIVGDPGAAISLSVAGRAPTQAVNSNVGQIAAQTGVAAILGSISAPGGSILLNGGTNSEFYLGAQSALDVQGTALVNVLHPQFRTGNVLSGGTVTVNLANDGVSALVALPGAEINISGASDVFAILSGLAPGNVMTPQPIATPVWSDAGTINISAPTLLYDGKILANPGASAGNGGNLVIRLPQPGVLTVLQTSNVVPDGFLPTDAIPQSLTGQAFFQANRLLGSGVANLTLAAAPNLGDVPGAVFSPGNLVFSGNIDIPGLKSLSIDASVIALTNVGLTTAQVGCESAANVCLSANYVALLGAGNSLPSPGKGTLEIDSQTIDIAAGNNGIQGLLTLSGVAVAHFITAGDIRLREPLANAATLNTATAIGIPIGELVTAGDLTLQAAQIYPTSSVDFTLKSTNAAGTISFLANGTAPSLPLSAGGQLTVSAANIRQQGTILAPLGVIRLGAQSSTDLSPNDPIGNVFVATKTVMLAQGSITSVSLNGLNVPYGETANGQDWTYDSSTGLPLPAAPSKNIAISGAAIQLAAGATVDLRGGGDIQAIEFVPGTGGSKDVLSEPGVYAIIPGYNPAAAATDLDFLFVRGDQVPAPGSSVFLSGGLGLAPANYTLLPAHYATLPGAYLIRSVANTQDAPASQNTVLADGTLQVAGYFSNPLNGTHDAHARDFDVQSSVVWRQYSELDQTSGDAYFAAQGQNSANPPPLPRDAGHLAFQALSSLEFIAGNQLLLSPDTSGRGAELDIAAQDIQILAPGATPRNGYTGIDATQLSAFGAGSLVIGGVRTDDSTDPTIRVISDSVEVSNNASTPLQAPEIILVTRVHPQNGDPNANRGLRLDKGSAIAAGGAVAIRNTSSVTLGNTAKNIDGSGALLAISATSPITIERENTQENSGTITIASGATITSAAALSLDSTGTIQIADDATFAAADIAIASRNISFGLAPSGTSGLVVSNAVLEQLEQAKNLTIRSGAAINFYGTTDITLAAPGSDLVLDGSGLVARNGGTIEIAADTVDLINSGSSPTTFGPGSATLSVSARDITLDSGDKVLGEFASATFTGSQQIVTQGSGSIAAGAAALTFDTPLLLVGSSAQQAITTTGAVNIRSASGAETPTTAAEIGGTLSITAGSIMDSALIQATAGGVTLEASSGDISLSAEARILAGGFVQTFFDQTRFAGGGKVQLIADAGRIEADMGARVDVSSPVGQLGNAGQITLAAPNGTLLSGNGTAFDPTIVAGTIATDSGGSLIIDAQSIGTSSISVPSIFSNAIGIQIRQGDLQLASNLTARMVTLAADRGTLTIDKVINASGMAPDEAGGTISLYGQSVILTSGGALTATAFNYQDPNSTLRGGSVSIGTTGGIGSNGRADLQINSDATINVSGGGEGIGGTVRLRAPIARAGNIYDSTKSTVAIDPVNGSVVGASSVTVEAYQVFTPANTNAVFDGIIDPAGTFDSNGNALPVGQTNPSHIAFYQTDLVNFVQGFSLANQSNFSSIGPAIIHYQPGIELDNDNPTINNADITVASNWNLGAGTAGYLVNATDITKKNQPTIPAGTVVTDENGRLLPQYANYSGSLSFLSGVSQIASLDYRVGGSPTGEPGTLTLRALRDVNINASITDGFFQTENRLNAKYLKAINAWVADIGLPDPSISDVGGYVLAGGTYHASSAGAPPLAPYDPAANGISPSGSSIDPAPMAGADLFPLINGNTAIASWSYNISGGADLTSANPVAVQPLAVFADANGTALAGQGNVVINGHTDLGLANINSDGGSVHIEIPTIVRTGTGTIAIAAARDVALADTRAPGVVYAAGHNTPDLLDPGFELETIPDPTNPGNFVTLPTARNPTGFLQPLVLTCDPGSTYLCNPYGAITAAAFPVGGGNIAVTAQQDILGFEHPTVASAGLGQIPNQQYFMPWLFVQGTPLSDSEFGAFSPLSGYVSTGNIFTPSQTAWWINFGSFDQGFMSVGGNAFIKAGRDISQLSVSLPTLGRVSGGLIDPEGNVTLPVLQTYNSGDLTVIAGRNLLSGAYYEGSGAAHIIVGGSVKANWATPDLPGPTADSSNEVSTVLAVDTGTINLIARGSVDIAGVVSGTSLQNVADTTIDPSAGVFVSSYGPASKVSLKSVSGDVIANSLYDADALVDNLVFVENNQGVPQGYLGVSAYPANFEATALLGNVQIADSLKLASSDHGTLDLLAYGSILAYTHPGGGTSFPSEAISAGASLVEQAFDPVQPLASFLPADSQVPDAGPFLLHKSDPNPDLIYAATGDIVSGPGLPGVPPVDSKAAPLAFEIDKPSVVHAGRDIIDLPFFGQNLASTDVTQIIAGRDIFYTDAWQRLAFGGGLYARNGGNAGGLSLAGPGFFDIEAGRNLGPFVTPAADILDSESNNPNSTGTGIIAYGNNVVVGNRLMLNDQVPSLGPASEQFAKDPNNFLLPRQGADIIALFGVANGIDYQAAIAKYIDPATSSSVRNYLPDLVVYLQKLGFAAQSPADSWTTFQALSPALQHVFVDQVFFSELRIPGDGSGCCFKDYDIGYSAISTLFPASMGYTDNGADGNGPAKQAATGNLDMIHGVIKTLQSATENVLGADGTATEIPVGGTISLLGPGGRINVGTTAVEIDKKLTNSEVGILTLDNGAIDTFTDSTVLVNQSRILTVQGGDILMWSSNGDLDAGRGAKTTVDFKPLTVTFDPGDLQTVNLNGLVSGAGIGTIQSTPDAPAASAFLIAPRGAVNAGAAGLRSSGNLSVAALIVLNAANISTVGTVTGVPQVGAVNLGALESTSAVGGQAAQAAQAAVAEAANRGQQVAPRVAPSLITVEVFIGNDPDSGMMPQ
jgi:filamentous hemagglutinin family protein